jgi:hypothetical protein
MEIQKYEPTFMLITIGGEKLKISENQERALRKTSSKKLVNINGITINTSSISSIMPMEEYYKQYPDQRPVVYQEFKAPTRNWRDYDNQKGLSQMIAGFKKHFNGRSMPEQSANILSSMEKSLIKTKTEKSFKGQPNPLIYMN